MKLVLYLMILCVISLAGCSTKKYLPKILDPDKAKVNINKHTLYYEKEGKDIPVIFIQEGPCHSAALIKNDTESIKSPLTQSPRSFIATEKTDKHKI